MGYYTPKRSHLKIAVLPQCEAFSADFAGRRSICALRRAKITEGERVVSCGTTRRFLCTNLGRHSISKETWPPHSLNPAAAEGVRWPRLFVKYLPRAKL